MNSLKKYFTPLNLIFFLELAIVVLGSMGLVPREAILVWTGLAIFFMIFSPVADSLWLVVASIPLAAALPISSGLDTLANWRVMIAVLFLVWLVKEIKSCYGEATKPKRFGGICLAFFKKIIGSGKVSYLAWGIFAFLLICALSIGVADYKVLAVKKLLFWINIFLLFFVVRQEARSKEDILRVWQAMATGAVAVIAVALIQFAAVLFVPLINFWQFWAGKVISFFYGQNLADLLAYANTWFAYYNSAPPTLRLFSIFPDSHSFAMFSLLSVPVFLCLAIYFGQKKKFFWLLAGLALLGAVFSGSRGVWISALPVLAVALYFWFKEPDKEAPKQAVYSLAIFAVIFLASTIYPPLFYKVQEWQTGQYSSSTISFFERARSISDLDETSNKGRLEIWRNSLLSIKEHPILGVGTGNFISVINEGALAAKKGASAHNLYLDVAAEVGLTGLLTLLVVFADILWTSCLVWRRSADKYFKVFGLIFGLYFVWILGYSFFDVVLFNDKVLLFFAAGAATLYNLRESIFKSEKT